MPPSLPLDHFMESARAHVEALTARLPLRSAVLDRWGGAVRIVYGCDAVERCAPVCEGCELYALVGEDLAVADLDAFRPSLRRATPRQLETFSAKQRMMNCKALAEYGAAFVEWLVHRCPDREALRAELDLLLGFRLLLTEARPATPEDEQAFRAAILRNALGHPQLGAERHALLEELLRERGWRPHAPDPSLRSR